MAFDRINEQARLAAQARRQKISKMLLRGLTNKSDMAASFGVDPNTITEDIKVIKQEWLQNSQESAQERASLRTMQIEAIAILALESYERSREDEIEITVVEKACDNPACTYGIVKDAMTGKNTECQRCLGTSKVSIETRKVKGKAGDANFLNTAKACFVECARIEGLYPSVSSVFKKTVETEVGSNGEILEKVEELYIEAPMEDIIKARAMLDDLRTRHREAEMRKKLELKNVNQQARTDRKEDSDPQ